jgi:hypothetical protein
MIIPVTIQSQTDLENRRNKEAEKHFERRSMLSSAYNEWPAALFPGT